MRKYLRYNSLQNLINNNYCSQREEMYHKYPHKESRLCCPPCESRASASSHECARVVLMMNIIYYCNKMNVAK